MKFNIKTDTINGQKVSTVFFTNHAYKKPKVIINSIPVEAVSNDRGFQIILPERFSYRLMTYRATGTDVLTHDVEVEFITQQYVEEENPFKELNVNPVQ